MSLFHAYLYVLRVRYDDSLNTNACLTFAALSLFVLQQDVAGLDAVLLGKADVSTLQAVSVATDLLCFVVHIRGSVPVCLAHYCSLEPIASSVFITLSFRHYHHFITDSPNLLCASVAQRSNRGGAGGAREDHHRPASQVRHIFTSAALPRCEAILSTPILWKHWYLQLFYPQYMQYCTH